MPKLGLRDPGNLLVDVFPVCSTAGRRLYTAIVRNRSILPRGFHVMSSEAPRIQKKKKQSTAHVSDLTSDKFWPFCRYCEE